MRITGAKSSVLVLIQFACIVFLMATTNWRASYPALFILFSGSLLLLWAVFTMRKSKLRVLAEPAQGARLITSGPYRWIRHPMYTSLIICMLSTIVLAPTFLRVLIWLALVVVLYIKLTFEESLLLERFPEYTLYQLNSYKLFPFAL